MRPQSFNRGAATVKTVRLMCLLSRAKQWQTRRFFVWFFGTCPDKWYAYKCARFTTINSWKTKSKYFKGKKFIKDDRIIYPCNNASIFFLFSNVKRGPLQKMNTRRCKRRMKKISWTDKIINVEALKKVLEKRIVVEKHRKKWTDD